MQRDDAFTEVWRDHHDRLVARATRMLGDAASADDVVQEALIRAWTKRAQFDPQRGTPAAWLLAITADQARRARSPVKPNAPNVTAVPAMI